MSDYISSRVKAQLADTIKNRDVLETDSSIKIFTRTWNWLRLIFSVAAALLLVTGAFAVWRASGFLSNVRSAEKSVTDAAKQSITDITQATLHSKEEITKETSTFQKDLEGSRKELQAASKLQPEMAHMKKQLSDATASLTEQQKIISSSEEFVKRVFSSQLTEITDLAPHMPPNTSYGVCVMVQPPNPRAHGDTFLYILLGRSPVPETLQLQYQDRIVLPANYARIVHNLVYWHFTGASTARPDILVVSYFPDNSDKDLIHALTDKGGRCFADDEPLLKIYTADPDFKGNKWTRAAAKKP